MLNDTSVASAGSYIRTCRRIRSSKKIATIRDFHQNICVNPTTSSGNTSKTYSFDMPWPISTKLSHKNPWPMAFTSYDQNGVKGHVGVTGVKKVKNPKTPLLQITGYDHVTHVYASAWQLLQKIITLKIHLGSFGVTGVKRSFSLKML